jgi:hypothetical protein
VMSVADFERLSSDTEWPDESERAVQIDGEHFDPEAVKQKLGL